MFTPRFLIPVVMLLLPGALLLNALDQRLYDDSEVAVIEVSCAPDAIPWMWEHVWSDSMHLASIHFHNAWLDTTVDSVGLRLRGNTSRPSQKKSFKLSFNTFVPGRQFFGVDKLNLNGEHNDPSIIRSKLCWDLYHTIGITASVAAPAALYINGDYFGLYISVEHIDDEFLQDRYVDDSGNLWKCLWPADLAWRGPNPEDYHPWVDEERPYELKTNTDEYDYSQLVRLIDIINNTPEPFFMDSLEAILKVPRVIEYFAINALVGGWDDYRYLMNNYYLYHEPARDRFHWIPYDYDNTFGVDWFDIDWAQVDPWWFGVSDPHPLSTRILATPCYSNFFARCLEFYNAEVFDLALWEDRLDSLHQLITPWAEADSFRTLDYSFNLADFHDSFDADPWSNQHVKRGIKEFVNLRNASLPEQLQWQAAIPYAWAIDWQPRQPTATDTIVVTAASCGAVGVCDMILQYFPGDTLPSLLFPMWFDPVPGTKRLEEAERWRGELAPLGPGAQGSFNIRVLGCDGPEQTYPLPGRIPLQTPVPPPVAVRINEFMPSNSTTIADPQGEWDDWLELINCGDTPVGLLGYTMSDNYGTPTEWAFPDTTIAPGQHLLVWCDEDTLDAGLHADFKLSAGGEQLILCAPNGAVIDSVTFAATPVDWSRHIPCDAEGPGPGTPGDWELTDAPTPWALNTGCLDPIEQLHILLDVAGVLLYWLPGDGTSWRVYRSTTPYGVVMPENLIATVYESQYFDYGAFGAECVFYAVTSYSE